MDHPWALYFQGSEVLISCCDIWSGSICKRHIALQEIQAVALMLYKMAFWFSGKVFALHLDNNTAEAYLCI